MATGDASLNIKLFRSLYRKTLKDWALSFLRPLRPLEPCRLWHRWERVHFCPEYVYEQCIDCAERRSKQNDAKFREGWMEQFNQKWLDYEELEFRVTRTNFYFRYFTL